MNVYLELNRAKAGPFTRDQVEVMYRSGAIDGATLAWGEGCSKWMPLQQLLPIEGPPERVAVPPLPGKADMHPLVRYLMPVGRVGRGMWCLRDLVHLFGAALLFAPFMDSDNSASGLWAFLLLAAFGYLTVIHAAKRCHDLNLSGWLAPLVFFPVLPLLFLILSGTQGENRYGPPPTNKFFS